LPAQNQPEAEKAPTVVVSAFAENKTRQILLCRATLLDGEYFFVPHGFLNDCDVTLARSMPIGAKGADPRKEAQLR